MTWLLLWQLIASRGNTGYVLVRIHDDLYKGKSMQRVLTTPALREDLQRRGLARAREFSWERSIARVRQIYDEVMQ